jgi:predicted nuclease of predicted toxin-antitoxin system
LRFLFDQNLSRHLVGMLSVEYPDSRHVTELGLDTATDAEIWTYAGEHGFVIVSKDSDSASSPSCTVHHRRRSG